MPIRLSRQPTQILLLLVERAGEVVTREEIQRLTWGPETVVDFEMGLNRCVRQIRSALVDNADTPRYIETIPRVGYRFIATVIPLTFPAEIEVQSLSEPADAPSAAIIAGTTGEKNPQPARRWTLFFALTALLLAAAIVLILISRRHELSPRELHPVPLATDLGEASSPTFSPDGQQIAFVWNGENEDNFDIYVRMVGSQAIVRLTKSPDIDYSPAWSPDGSSIAFCRGTNGEGSAIWLISPLGGPERKLVDLVNSATPDNRSLSWSPQAKWLAYADDALGLSSGALFLVNIQTGQKQQLTFPGPTEVDMFPAFSPDGTQLAFTRDTGRGISGIYVLPVHPGVARKETPRMLKWPDFKQAYCGRSVWTLDGKHVLFSSNRTGEFQYWMAPADGSEKPVSLASLGSGVMDAAISKDGKLAFVQASSDVNIWKLDVGPSTSGANPKRAVASTRMESNPKVSPDGRKLAFESDRSGFREIWVSNLDGSGALALTTMQNPVTGSPAWSHDGRWIAFDSRAGGSPAIYVISSDGGVPRKLTDGSNWNVLPSWSADDAYVYFSSDRSGKAEIWKVRRDGGPAQKVTQHGGVAALSSPDGSSLYYAANQLSVTSLRKIDLATGKETDLGLQVLRRRYKPTAKGIFYIAGNPYHDQSLFVYNTASGKSERLFKLDRTTEEGMDLSPDGMELFFGQLDYGGRSLMLVRDFDR